MKSIKINDFEISNDKPFTLIVGPCVLENRDHALTIAEDIKYICVGSKKSLCILYFDFINENS